MCVFLVLLCVYNSIPTFFMTVSIDDGNFLYTDWDSGVDRFDCAVHFIGSVGFFFIIRSLTAH